MTVRPDRSELLAWLPFAPDRFQTEAIDALLKLDAGGAATLIGQTFQSETWGLGYWRGNRFRWRNS